MKGTALLRLATIVICTALALGAALPAQARSDWFNQGAPHWLDQTVYRPDCLPTDCACDCRSELCLPACVKW